MNEDTLPQTGGSYTRHPDTVDLLEYQTAENSLEN